jgi:hypothetical protein
LIRKLHWRLSAAYDLTPSPVVAQDRRDLAMEPGDLGRLANAENMLVLPDVGSWQSSLLATLLLIILSFPKGYVQT